jgi:3-deoxy-D-manno-octulosonate 8-phosphate phosphatase (KDO 8-P phosphatase)
VTTNIELKLKAQKIKLVAFDVDGVMTDGSLTFVEDGREIKTYNAKDGQGIVMLNKANIVTSIITARENNTVRMRAKILGITRLFEGQKNKCLALDALCKEFNLKYHQIAYMGDDMPDLCVLEKVGLAACPSDAVDEVLAACDFISTKAGGRGAVREFCDLILKAKGVSWSGVSTQ